MDILEKENTIKQFQLKINEFKLMEDSENIDCSEEIKSINIKIKELEEELYKDITPWDRVIIAREQKRPRAKDYINAICDDFLEFHGDRLFGDDKAIIGGIGTISGHSVTIIGEQKGVDMKDNITRNFGMPAPEGYRKALRLMKQSEKFNRPIITIIDTPGAFCGITAEEGGQGEAIARNLFEMSSLSVPVITFLIGEGGSGGALAIGVSNKIYMLENSVYSVLSPEGFASILWKDGSRSKEAAEVMKITAEELLAMNIIEGIVEEPIGGAQKDPGFVSEAIKKLIIKDIKNYAKKPKDEIVEERYERFRKFGEFKEVLDV